MRLGFWGSIPVAQWCVWLIVRPLQACPARGPVPGALAGICVVDPGLAVDRVHGDALGLNGARIHHNLMRAAAPRARQVLPRHTGTAGPAGLAWEAPGDWIRAACTGSGFLRTRSPKAIAEHT